jgi:large subunit ribosomal protein L24
VRTGDKVRILRGQFKGREGKVESVSVKDSKIFIAKIETLKKDGATKVPYPVDASNVVIVEFDATDKRRNEALKTEKKSSAKKAPKQK